MTDHTSPPSARVTVPAQLPSPVHADVAVWRPATTADIDAIWQLEIAIGRADHPNYVRELLPGWISTFCDERAPRTSASTNDST